MFYAVQAAIGFSLLILVHELGHFLAAKWQGIRVEVFSLGFGPGLKRTWGGTEYRLSMIPLGGYVKLAGEEPSPDKPPAPDEFYGKSVGRRAIVFVAGVVMNIIFGFICFIVAYQVGVPVVPAKVGAVQQGSPAWKTGVKRGDVITRINHLRRDLDFEDLNTTILLADPGEKISLGIERNGSRLDLQLVPEYDEELGRMFAGIYRPSTLTIADRDSPAVRKAIAGEPPATRRELEAVYQAGLRGGDTITAVHLPGRAKPVSVETPGDFLEAAGSHGEGPIRIAFTRNGTPHPPVTVQPVPNRSGWIVGVRLGPTHTLEIVRQGSWAGAAGLAAGDVILSVAGRPTRSGSEVMHTLDETAGAAARVNLLRGGAERSIIIPPGPHRAQARDVIAFAIDNLVVDAVKSRHPAADRGIRPGDRILAVDGRPCREFEEFHGAISNSGGRVVAVTYARNGATAKADLTPVRPRTVRVILEPDRARTHTGIARSFRLGARKSFQWIVRVYAMVKSLLLGTISPRHLSSPLAIVYVTYAAARENIGVLLYFLAVISVNLGVVNLLPIPILDGGHLLFAALEKVRGKPVNEHIRSIASYVGLALLLAIFAVALWNDIWKLFLR